MTSSNDSAWLYPPLFEVRRVVAVALAEDLSPLGDLTSSLLPPMLGEARIAARESGRLAGTLCVNETYAQLDPAVEVSWSVDEGAQVAAKGLPFQ